VMHAVKELFQIQVHHPVVAFLQVLLSPDNRLRRRTLRAKPVTVVRKGLVPLRLQDLEQGLLEKAVQDRGDASFPHATSRFRDLHPLHRARSIPPYEEARPYLWPVLPSVARPGLDGHPIEARPAPIGFDAGQRRQEMVPLDHALHQSLVANWSAVSGCSNRCFTPSLGTGQWKLLGRGHASVQPPVLLLPTVLAFGTRMSLLCRLLTPPLGSGLLSHPSATFRGSPLPKAHGRPPVVSCHPFRA
jgi:hypothetical protein